MPSKRPPSPKEVIKVRRLPKVGDRITIEVEVTRVDEPEGHHQGRVTYRAPGAPAPVTVGAQYVVGNDD